MTPLSHKLRAELPPWLRAVASVVMRNMVYEATASDATLTLLIEHLQEEFSVRPIKALVPCVPEQQILSSGQISQLTSPAPEKSALSVTVLLSRIHCSPTPPDYPIQKICADYISFNSKNRL
ncbi:hypothetical protein PoB_000080800 [Plakobranchus ocellatus]|uniref:Uncharacterized protein n=1 Tax=Plakobranchus ocellatus TaxID=259542 RepID=A0AAV3XWE3_9GAST|nr:hypothetical protein PoB_000080800 [Plakobranchus ocellatus]